MRALTVLLLVLMLLPLVIFIYRYARYSPWTSTIQGRSLMAQKIGWVALIGHFLVELFWEYPGHDVVEIILLGLLMVLFWTVLFGLLVAQTAQLPVSKRQGTGYVNARDIETTIPRKRLFKE